MQKILVADDSTTIQKVIKMTLEDRNYDLLAALSEDEMMEMVDESVDLLLLDFSLSSDKSGIELVEKLHSKLPGLKVVALLSTFDQVDKTSLTSNGFHDSVTKPFDSTSFLELIEGSLEATTEDVVAEDPIEEVEEATVEEEPIEEIEEATVEATVEEEAREIILDETDPLEEVEDVVAKEEDTEEEGITLEEEDLDEWTVSEDAVVESSDHENSKIDLEEISASDLDSVVEDWGVEVPAPLNNAQNFAVIPPVIEESSAEEIKVEDESMADGSKIPEGDDLEYPDMNTSIEASSDDDAGSDAEVIFPEETSPEELEDLEDLDTSSTPISLDTLTDVVEDEDDDVTDPNIQLSNYEGNLDKLVSDETEGDDLWSVDDGLKVDNISPINIEEDYSPTLETAEEEIEELPQEDTMIDAAVDETIQTAFNSFNRDEFLAEVKSELKREMLGNREFVDELRKEVMVTLAADPQFRAEIKSSFIEEMRDDLKKISWEVIPDLAENLIRDEIKSISNKL